MSAAREVIDGFVKEGNLSEADVQRIEQQAQDLVKEAVSPEAEMAEWAKATGGATGEAKKTVRPGIMKGVEAIKRDPKLLLPIAGLAAAIGGGGVLAQALAQSGVGGADELLQAAMKGRRYRRMLEVHPELENYDATNVQRAFTTLNRFNPEIASDPLVAGTFVKGVMGMGGELPHKTVGELVKTRAEMKRPPGMVGATQAGTAFTAAMKGVAG